MKGPETGQRQQQQQQISSSSSRSRFKCLALQQQQQHHSSSRSSRQQQPQQQRQLPLPLQSTSQQPPATPIWCSSHLATSAAAGAAAGTSTATMLTDMTPTAGQLYGSQIPAMGMNISNIATHLQKPQVNPVSRNLKSQIRRYQNRTSRYVSAR